MKRRACEFRSATVSRSLDDDYIDGTSESRRIYWRKILVVLVGRADCIYSSSEIVHSKAI